MSALLGRIPSAAGYQPTLASEMGELQERIVSTKKWFDYVSPSDLRTGRRLYGSRSSDYLCSLGCIDGA